MKYDDLIEEADENGISVDEEYSFSDKSYKGLYIDGNIALSDELETDAERACILAEELGHHYTSYGDILNQAKTTNRKQEHKARVWAYKAMLTPSDLFCAFKAGCRNRYEISEFLGVSEYFLEDALNYFRTQYPNGYANRMDHYVIRFIPNLQVGMLF